MKQPEIKYENYTFRFPFANVIFGRVFQLPCEVLFDYTENSDGEMRLIINSLTGTTDDGVQYDLLYLTDDDDSMYSDFIIACILENKQFWNYTGETEWWE